MKRHLLLLVLLAITAACSSIGLRPVLNVSWPAFLARHDLTYQWSPSSSMDNFYSGVWGGNGCLGFVMFASPIAPSELTFVVSRVDVYDDRNPSMPSFMNNFVYDQPRLPIADLAVWFVDAATNANLSIVEGTARSELYSGLTHGSINLRHPQDDLSLCSVHFTILVADDGQEDAADAAGFISLKLNTTDPSCARSIKAQVALVPHLARSTWWNQDASYVENPPPIVTNWATSQSSLTSNFTLSTQEHLNGTAHATGLVTSVSSANTSLGSVTAYVTISGVLPNRSAASGLVAASLARAVNVPFADFASRTSSGWKSYWESSGGFLTGHDTLFEGFYYIQLYKFRCAVRPNGTVHDLQGPWFFYGTDWPDLHWDMNVQQAYFLAMTGSNRLDLGKTFVDFVMGLVESGQLARNVRPSWTYAGSAPAGASSLQGMSSCYWDHAADCLVEPPTITGNLLWAAHVIELYSNYSGNQGHVVEEKLWPILTQALSSYQYFQEANSSGTYHLPPTFSPEYPGPRGPDCNYDISLYRWGLQRALSYAAQYNLTHPLLSKFNDTFRHLTFMPIDNSTGCLEVYRGIPFTIPHRHYSHLFSVWPLHIGDLQNAAWHDVAEKSIDQWLNDPASDSEFFRPVASKMSMLLGRPGAAYGNISTLIYNFFFVHSNTFYGESGGPCTETPYAAAWAISELFAQSWNTSLDFFPAIPDVIIKSSDGVLASLADAAFFRLRTMGGYLISAKREVLVENSTHVMSNAKWLVIERPSSHQDTKITFSTTMIRPLKAVDCDEPLATIPLLETGGNYAVLAVPAGTECVAVFSGGSEVPTELEISPSAGNASYYNFWGFPDRRF